MLKTTRIRRLTKLKERLEQEQKIIFDMEAWATHNGEHSPKEKNFCGTAACALGLATFIPSFRKSGLRLKWQYYDNSKQWRAHVVYGDEINVAAGAKFFGLSPDFEAPNLFMTISCSREEVIQKIQELIEETK